MFPIYIVSAGRPHCTTAVTLNKIGVNGFNIVVSTEDKALDEYINTWGEDRIVTYSYSSMCESTDMLDNFDDGVCGAAPARNGVISIAKENQDAYFWMLDDDIMSFTMPKKNSKSRKTIKTEDEFRKCIVSLEDFMISTDINCLGFACDMQAFPPKKTDINKYVRQMYLMNASKIPYFKSRMEEDLPFSYDIWRTGGISIALRAFGFRTKGVCEEKGGCTTIYEKNGTVRRAAYNVLSCPQTVVKKDKFGYSGFPLWNRIAPKIVREGFMRYE